MSKQLVSVGIQTN